MGLRWFLAAVVLASVVVGGAVAQPLDKPPGLDPREVAGRPIPQVPRLDPLEGTEDAPSARPQGSRESRIEQHRQGNRVSEIVVTPAGRSYSYTIQNREGRRPTSQQELTSGLSTPRFLKLEF